MTGRRELVLAVGRYGLARLALVAGVAGLLTALGVPLLVALLVALVSSVPLSLLLLKRLRRELNEALAAAGRERTARRRLLRAQLRGDDSPAQP